MEGVSADNIDCHIIRPLPVFGSQPAMAVVLAQHRPAHHATLEAQEQSPWTVQVQMAVAHRSSPSLWQMQHKVVAQPNMRVRQGQRSQGRKLKIVFGRQWVVPSIVRKEIRVPEEMVLAASPTRRRTKVFELGQGIVADHEQTGIVGIHHPLHQFGILCCRMVN